MLIFLAAVAVLLLAHTLWLTDRSEKRAFALLDEERKTRAHERQLWDHERLALLERVDALRVPVIAATPEPVQPAAPVDNSTEAGEYAVTERLRLLEENGSQLA